MIKSFDIPFVGLKQGLHYFNFKVEKSFFDYFPYSLIEKGSLNAEVSLEKKRNHYDFELYCQWLRRGCLFSL